MKETGVFATKEEFEELQRIASGGWKPGDRVMILSIAEGISKGQKTVDAKKLCHAVALKHGLPEIEGYYGLNLEGEFVTC